MKEMVLEYEKMAAFQARQMIASGYPRRLCVVVQDGEAWYECVDMSKDPEDRHSGAALPGGCVVHTTQSLKEACDFFNNMPAEVRRG